MSICNNHKSGDIPYPFEAVTDHIYRNESPENFSLFHYKEVRSTYIGEFYSRFSSFDDLLAFVTLMDTRVYGLSQECLRKIINGYFYKIKHIIENVKTIYQVPSTYELEHGPYPPKLIEHNDAEINIIINTANYVKMISKGFGKHKVHTLQDNSHPVLRFPSASLQVTFHNKQTDAWISLMDISLYYEVGKNTFSTPTTKEFYHYYRISKDDALEYLNKRVDAALMHLKTDTNTLISNKNDIDKKIEHNQSIIKKLEECKES